MAKFKIADFRSSLCLVQKKKCNLFSFVASFEAIFKFIRNYQTKKKSLLETKTVRNEADSDIKLIICACKTIIKLSTITQLRLIWR